MFKILCTSSNWLDIDYVEEKIPARMMFHNEYTNFGTLTMSYSSMPTPLYFISSYSKLPRDLKKLIALFIFNPITAVIKFNDFPNVDDPNDLNDTHILQYESFIDKYIRITKRLNIHHPVIFIDVDSIVQRDLSVEAAISGMMRADKRKYNIRPCIDIILARPRDSSVAYLFKHLLALSCKNYLVIREHTSRYGFANNYIFIAESIVVILVIIISDCVNIDDKKMTIATEILELIDYYNSRTRL